MPKKVRVVFVAESPPYGGTFFYDCANLSVLLRHTMDAFRRVPELNADTSSCERFHLCFREMGFYLEDLCHEPINKLETAERKARRLRCVPFLAERLRRLSPPPRRAATLMVAIRHRVNEALREAGLASLAPAPAVPFPAWRPENVEAFEVRLALLLRQYLSEGIVSPCEHQHSA